MANVGIIEVLAVTGRQRLPVLCRALNARGKAARLGVVKETAKLLADGLVREVGGCWSLTWAGLMAAHARLAARNGG